MGFNATTFLFVLIITWYIAINYYFFELAYWLYKNMFIDTLAVVLEIRFAWLIFVEIDSIIFQYHTFKVLFEPFF